MTDFCGSQVETDKTDKTYSVSNVEFLLSVFGDESAGGRPLLVSFKGNPREVPRNAWFGRPLPRGREPIVELPPDANNYFSLAVFGPDENGEYRRRKSSFQALYAVVLDDVGSKVPRERLTLTPSWLLETSPGNYQAGYLLMQPLTDGLAADRLMNAIIAAGLCDPGANGPRARLGRLPKGANGKHSPPFTCRMVAWSPTLRYSVQDLVSGLQLEMASPDRPKRQREHPAQERPLDGDPVLIPRPEENAVLIALRGRGLYKAPLGDGKHDITCPWVQEHTGQVDGGTAYFEPDEIWPIGGLKCHHGHCAGRNIRDLLRVLDIEVSEARMKPTIRVMPGELNRIVDAAERELAQTRRYYQRGGLIVTVITDPGTRETRVQEVSQAALVRALAAAAFWERYDCRSQDWARTDPPARHAAALFDSSSYPHLHILNGLSRQPYLRPDGSLMTQAGYDQATGMFGIFDAREYSIPDAPNREQAMASLALLAGLLDEFPFACMSDWATALCAMLTAVIRPSLPNAPMYHVKAPMVGSGKSYLCELITAFATPQCGSPMTFPGDDEECRKMLLAELLRAPAVIQFDNLTGDLLAHKSLCTALTSEFMSGRILGVSKTATVGTRVLFLSSGNNVGPIQDMSRRCLTIQLTPSCEIPASRNFKRPDLLREVMRNRGLYVSAALTMVRAWIVAGRPKATCKALAGFSDWSDLCRQPLMWLDCMDPAISVFETMAEDPDRETLGRLLTAWHTAFGKAPAMVRDAVKEASAFQDENVDLREVLNDIADERGEINRRKLGWWIRRDSGRNVNGLRFVRASGSRSAEAWRVEEVESVLPVLSVSAPSTEKTVSEKVGR